MSEFKWTDELVKEYVKDVYRELSKWAPWSDQHKLAATTVFDRFKASKQPKPEWEILEVKGPSGAIYVNVEWNEKYQGYSIHSVKRLSDGEVFTVGDGVKYKGVTGTIPRFNIEKFKIAGTSLLAGEANRWVNIIYVSKCAPQPIPVYLTPAEVEKLKTLLK